MARVDNVIYENGRGQLVVLDGEGAPWREVMGRTGFGVPPTRYTETVYAGGVAEITNVRLEARDATLMFWAERADEAAVIDWFRRLKAALVEVGAGREHGKLRLRCSDGRWVFLNCIYAGGLSSEAEDDARFKRFTLDFHGSDPLFYDLAETQVPFNDPSSQGLRMRFRFGAGTRFKSARAPIFQHLFRLNAFTAYPNIEVTGPARGIRFDNSADERSIFFDEQFELKTGEKLRIGTRPMYEAALKTGTDGTVTDVTNRLAPGATLRWGLINGDNLITLRMTDTGPETSCTFSYREGHLSVW